MRRIIVQHGLHHNKRVDFEFLHVDKNAYFQDIVRERNMTEEQKMENRDDLLLESIQRAQEAATESSSLLFFKSNIKWYKRLNLGAWNGNISFAGIYRANVLDRCICMVRDCFWETKGVGTSVFGSNGTKTDVCFGRRNHPELDVRANFTDVKECLRRGQEKVDFVRNQGFHSFATEVLFQFENSMNDQDFEISISAWMKLLRPLLQGCIRSGCCCKGTGRRSRYKAAVKQQSREHSV